MKLLSAAIAVSLALTAAAGPSLAQVPPPQTQPADPRSNSQIVSELTLLLDLGGTVDQQNKAVDTIIAQPDVLPPWHYLKVCTVLWLRGDRQQAAFWFYIFKIRANAWGRYDPSVEPMVNGFSRDFGQIVDRWIQGDDAVWRDTYARALSYERRIPLYPHPPEGVSAETWQREMADWRQSAQAEQDRAFALTEKELAKRRKRDKVKPGPLQNAGAPLPDDWR
ncbi:hypothetical protein QO010_004745 [Caulobacter ginsengisoli]|uniref:Uncharacterized protein n=1 Tax=Caulobacter ginsengisoli TaxID=400775 RepID=A0ABU0J0J3_9CAUL|nr:hypothetical protein [Caulobacter ginsengisoli]MDQ0466948.1 hypothetical protein [Caulobacter ginsengisoli]